MVNVTFAVPEELHAKMKAHAEIKWSEIARQAIASYANKLDEDRQWKGHARAIALKDWDKAGDLFEI